MISPPDSSAEASAGEALPPDSSRSKARSTSASGAGGGADAAVVSPDPAAGSLGRRERMVLAAVAALLALLLFWLRGGLHPAAPLERLARQSPDLTTALADGRPTLVEFYADWCEACRAMAPAMEAIEQRRRGELDVVLLNVDNPRWQPELERYAVNGIPQLELFDASGRSVGRSIGARRPGELEALTSALVEGRDLPQLVGVGATSSLREGDDPGGDAAIAATSGSASAGTAPEGDRTASADPAGQVTPHGSALSPSGRPAPIGPRSHG